MRRKSSIYSWPVLILCLLFAAGCGAATDAPASGQAQETPQASAAAAPSASPEASDGHGAHETAEAAGTASPSPSPEVTAAATDSPEKTDKPERTEKPETSPTAKPTPKASGSPAAATAKPAEKTTAHTVEITNFAFSPETLEISKGDTVTFINKDEVSHTATADDGSFDTGLLAQKESKTVTFNETGEFGYYCEPHPGMRGTIIVK